MIIRIISYVDIFYSETSCEVKEQDLGKWISYGNQYSKQYEKKAANKTVARTYLV